MKRIDELVRAPSGEISANFFSFCRISAGVTPLLEALQKEMDKGMDLNGKLSEQRI